MEAFNGNDLSALAVEALLAAGADKAQASLSRGEQSELNVDAGRMSLYRTTVNVSLGLTAHAGGRKGSVSINRVDERSIREAAAEAYALARSSEPDPANDVAPSQPPRTWDTGPAAPDSEAMYGRLREFMDYARKAYPKTSLEQCVLDFSRGESFYANSNGVRLSERSGLYSFFAMFTSKDGENASSFNYSGAAHRTLGKPLKDWGTIDGLMRQSAEQTRVSPAEGAFEGDVILTPDCLGDFIGYLDSVYLGDYALITGNSPWKDSLCEPVASPLLSVRSEPASGRVEVGYAYTGDGFIAEDCTLIDGGRLANYTLGYYGSRKTGKGRCPSGGGAIVVEPGSTALSDMIKDVKRGVLLARFSGGSPSDNGDFSGVAKNSYLVEDGAIVRPIGETMLAGNLASLFSSIRAISKESVDYGSAVLPWVLAGGVTVSGS